jgi:hypothetical protein
LLNKNRNSEQKTFLKLPKADLYVWEELPRLLPKDPYVSAKMGVAVFQSYLVAILNQNSDSKQVGYVIGVDLMEPFRHKFVDKT